MLKNIYLLSFAVLVIYSCVSSKTFNEIEDRYADLKIEHSKLQEKYYDLEKDLNTTKKELQALQKINQKTIDTLKKLTFALEAKKNNLKTVQDSYAALERNSNVVLKESVEKNRMLLVELEAKENRLAEETAVLQQTKKELSKRIQRIEELERLITNKELAMTKLKKSISKALLNFEGKGLTVNKKNGKVYVSMENKLLFRSGSWAIGNEGVKAVNQLGKVLSQNPEINILIEGHTDNQPYQGAGNLSGNWDLSTKRATAIVGLLEKNSKINPKRLTAAGRGEHSPIASNETQTGKAKNRRIEIILTPNLDVITELLKTIE